MTEPATRMVFRKFPEGDVIALMPEIPAGLCGDTCQSYMHLGQHSGASYSGVVGITKPATPEEYGILKSELEEHYGYNIKVVSRTNNSIRKTFLEGQESLWR